MNTMPADPAHTYRSDIDGLRAVAVLAVVLYHAGVPGFDGGFIGVDIFFVISGYLITSIIAREIAGGTFSVAAFYERRIRRIFPALFAVLAASSAAAAVIGLPHELDGFARSLMAATLFVSNVFFWQTADYFAGPAHLQPLLHTWSLAVEEQFYIVFPLLLLALVRWRQRALLPVLCGLTAASFLLSVWAVPNHPSAAFYLLPSRFWELMTGALLALGAIPAVTTPWLRSAAGLAGLGLIAGSVVFLSSALAFPGLNAVPACVGAALVIHAGSGGASPAARLLSLRPVVFLGLISYSLYLWHWPVLVFARLWHGEPLAAAARFALVLVSVAAAVLSWRLIERPFRERRTFGGRDALFRAAAAVMTMAIVAGGAGAMTGGWPQRFEGYTRPAIDGLADLRLGTCFLKDNQPASAWAGLEHCRSGPESGPDIFLWGDSFAAHLNPGLVAELQNRMPMVQYTAGGCPPLISRSFASRPHCRDFNDQALSLIAAHRPAVVVLSARWDAYSSSLVQPVSLQDTIEAVRKTGASVIVAGDSPSFDFTHPADYVFKKGREDARRTSNAQVRAALETLQGATTFDPASVLCEGDWCRLRENGTYLYFDGGHYSSLGSRKVARALVPAIEAAMQSTWARHDAAKTVSLHHLD